MVFIFNAIFDQTKMKYGKYYDNSQQHSQLFNEYLTNLANYLIKDKNVCDCKIVEIGCGDGFFLKKLISDYSLGNSGFGFDPSYSGPKTNNDGRLQFKTDFFDSTSLDFQPDIVIVDT